MDRYFILLSFCFMLLSLSLKGQYESVEWHHQEDGLPNDLVKAFEMDSLGFIWVATDDGLVKIEGRNYRNISIPPMFSNNFKNIISSKKYGLLTTADAGLLKIQQYYDGINGIHFNENNDILDWPKMVYPKTLFEAFDSAIWIADLQKIYRIHNEEIRSFDFPDKNYTDHFSRSYQFLELDSTHFFVLSQKGFLYILNEQKNDFTEVPWNYFGQSVYAVANLSANSFLIGLESGLVEMEFDKNGFLKELNDLNFPHPVSAIEKANDSTFIIGTWGNGAYILKFKEGHTAFEFLKKSENQIINDILIDKQNQIWLGTDLGVMFYRNVAFSEPFKNLTKKYVQDIRKGFNGKMFFSDGATVYEVDNDRNVIEFYKPKKGLVISIETTKSGVWMGKNDGEVIYKTFSNKITSYDFSEKGQGVYCLKIDKEANIWMIQTRPFKETLLKMDSIGNVEDCTPVIPNGGRVRALIISPSGEIFIGATGTSNYLFKYNYQNRIVDNISLPMDKQLIDPLSVIDIAFVDSMHLMLATKFGVWEYENDSIHQMDFGIISNDMVTSIALDSSKGLWFTNSNGLVNYANNEISIYNNADGLPAKTTNYRCLTIDYDNYIWLGTISGIAHGKIQFKNIQTPKPTISFIEKYGILINTSVTKSFVENSLLSFTFATPVYPAKYIKYEYMLKKNGNDAEWIELNGFKDNFIFNNLKKGDYTFLVRAKSKGNYFWSEPLEFHFSIYKTWYSRPGILALIYLTVFIFIWLYSRFNRIKSEKEKRKLELIIKNRTSDLRDQNEELKSLNLNLQQAKDASEAAIKTKDRFFSILAHDLKSPFNTLIGFSQLLVHNRNEISEESMEELLSEMLKISENTYNLLQNLLEWAMSQTGALKINKKQLLFIDLLNEIMPTLKDAAKQKNIEIEYEFSDSLHLYADEAVMGTVLRNLISNSIKFSNQNTKISISVIEKEHSIEISIVDEGIGIPEDRLKQLFLIDSNNSTRGTANETGTGLGLVLCNEFIKKSGGSIRVNSILGQGTTFVVQLSKN